MEEFLSDFYDILGVGRDASADDIKRAYRKLAVKYHPDRNSGDKAAEEKFKEINKAYEALSDPEKRKMYDQFGEDGLKGNPFQGGGTGFGGFDFGDAFGDFGDIFGEFFGGGSRSRRTQNAPRQGSDILVNVKISFEEAYKGAKKSIKVARSSACERCGGNGAEPGSGRKTCPTCNGHGQVKVSQGFFAISQTCPSCQGAGTIIENRCKSCNGTGFKREEKTLEVNIPAGIDSGQKIRVSGEGNSGANGGPRGDVYLQVNVADHPVFVRDENDIYMELPISYPQAVLGDRVEIPTMTGSVEMKIPAGSQPGMKLRMKGNGFPGLGRRPKGDQFVILRLEVPKNISADHRKVVEELKRFDSETSERPFLREFAEKVKNIFK